MSKSTGPGDPLLAEPSAFIFTDDSALPNGSAGWGVYITFPGIAETRAIWGQSLHPLQDATGYVLVVPPATLGNLAHSVTPWTESEAAQLPRPSLPTALEPCLRQFLLRPTVCDPRHQSGRIIARINALLDQVISISWTPAHTNSDDPLAQGNAEADKLAARGCAAPHLLTQFRFPAPASWSSALAVPLPSRPRSRRRSEVPLARGRSERPLIPLRNPRLPRFDFRQPVSWRANFSFSHSSYSPC